MSKTIIHVNQHRIRGNRKNGSRDPVITIKRGRTNRYGHQAVACDENGRELFRVVYRPDHPLSCGDRVWIETPFEVVPLDQEGKTIAKTKEQPTNCPVPPAP